MTITCSHPQPAVQALADDIAVHGWPTVGDSQLEAILAQMIHDGEPSDLINYVHGYLSDPLFDVLVAAGWLIPADDEHDGGWYRLATAP